MSINILDLAFDSEYYYIQKNLIVEKIIFNNRTLYSKFEKVVAPLNTVLIEQHLRRELTLALPLIQNNRIDYLVLEYKKEEDNRFYHLVKHLLKSLYMDKFYTYKSAKENHIQIFIPRENISLNDAYEETEKIKRMLELKSSKSCKILPNRNLPKNYNIITLPTQKM